MEQEIVGHTLYDVVPDSSDARVPDGGLRQPLLRCSPSLGRSAPAHQNEVSKDVILQSELASEGAIKWLLCAVYVSVAVGTTVLVGLAVMKMKVSTTLDSLEAWETYVQVNVAVASLDTLAMFVATSFYVIRVVQVARRGLRWSLRRKHEATLQGILFVSHTLNCLFYLVANVLVLRNKDVVLTPTFFWLGVGRDSMWNTIFLIFVLKSRSLNLLLNDDNRPGGGNDAILLDRFWLSNWWVFLIWVVLEAIFAVSMYLCHFKPELLFGEEDLSPKQVMCNMSPTIVVLVGTLTGIFGFYHILGTYFIYRGYKQLTKKPYHKYRGMNVQLRYHFLCSGTVGDLVAFSFLFLFWLRYDSCATGILTMFGILPCQFVMTVLAVVMCILDMPVEPGKRLTLAVHPNPLVWREEQKDCLGKDADFGGTDAPPFCFETSLKLWYWSLVVYFFDPATEKCVHPNHPELSFDQAMAMYDLDHYENIVEETCDTNVFVAWNDATILICFRGTYSASNVCTDLQLWRVPHFPKRSSNFMRTHPLVHRGFIKSWKALNDRIIAKVDKIMDSGGFDVGNARVLVTGHSLGGALAVLASLDMAVHCGIDKRRITCYTYGAPRVGNRTFVSEYNSMVPDTWQVVNDEDVVPRVPKFLKFFKHVGHKVIINGVGDLIVKPHMVEVSLYKMFTFFKRSSSLIQHSLFDYQKSYVAICKGQFVEGKAMEGGMEALSIMFEENEGLLARSLGVELSKLQTLECLGGGGVGSIEEAKGKRERCRVVLRRLVMEAWGFVTCSRLPASGGPEWYSIDSVDVSDTV
ncbi:hypothetical protein BSKO_09078 [Bryopsis sp. KO-2023]|nr:hypothetical protein BSKO_09078 [Bryopsis sp. KO-2023]